nr:MAG TPA: hydrolase [Caudoviricetes sp.]
MADKPVTREEKYLAYLTGDYKGEIPKPITRKEKYLYELCLKGIGGEISPEEIKNAVNEYLEKNPVKPGATTEQAQQIEQNKTDVASLKKETGSLKEDITKKLDKNVPSKNLFDPRNRVEANPVGTWPITKWDTSPNIWYRGCAYSGYYRRNLPGGATEVSQADTNGIKFNQPVAMYGLGISINVSGGVTYTLSFQNNANIAIIELDRDGNKTKVYDKGERTFTTQYTTVSVIIFFYSQSANEEVYITNIQFEVGTEPTPFISCDGVELLEIVNKKEDSSNKTSVISEESDANHYPTAKAVYDFIKSTKGGMSGSSILFEELTDPWVKTSIKLFGDSITHGMGATGFSATGSTIGTTGAKRDSSNSPSYANLLKNYIMDTFGKKITVPMMYGKNIIRNRIASPYNEGHMYFYSAKSGIIIAESDFYGDSIDVGYVQNTNYGKFTIYIDDIYKQTVDSYGELSNKIVTIATTSGKHNLKIKSTGEQNTVSSGYGLLFTHIGIQKIIEFENNGVSGYQSRAISATIRDLTNVDDTIVICMMGTNDRIANSGAWCTEEVAIYIANWLNENRPKAKLIFMSANPCSKEQDVNRADANYHMNDVDMALRRASNTTNTFFVSGYNACIDYLKTTGKPLSDICTDGVHPNDNGHNLIFRNLIEKIGLSIKNDWDD